MMSLDQTPINQLITDNIDTWTSTVKTKATTGRGSSKKLELYGVKKLRELILELAVRGKLVPQDPNDEPASELLLQSLEEKDVLLKQGMIKKSRSKKTIKEEHFYEYPASWAVSRLEDLIHVINGRAYKKAEMLSEGTPILRVGNLFTSNDWYYSDLELESDKYIDNGDLIYAWSASFGPFIWDGGKVIYHYHIWKMDIFREASLDKEFSKLFLQAISERIKASGNGIAMIHMTKERMEKVMHPLPPINEQKRIVHRVNELMTLCDQLEQQTEASIAAHQVLVTTLLDTLTNSANAEELMQNWQLVAEHFDTLFTTEESIDQLKQTILQLAVMGKLVPQDPNDEPAAKLLERIAEEKAQLVREKKIKKHPNVEPIGNVGIIPKTWKAIVVQDFADIRLGSTPSRHESSYWNGNIPWVSSGEVANGVIVDTAEKITQSGFDNSSTSIIPKGSLLMAIIGQGKTRGQTALLDIDACTNQNVAAFVFNGQFIIPEYVWLWAQSKYESHRQGGHGGAQPALNGKKVRSFAFPLPPTEEQKRIVEKVKKLNSLCEQLKTRLKGSQVTQLHLTDAIVEQAV
nr:restriction endonuclease subunit S [Vibrio sinaloensis]